MSEVPVDGWNKWRLHARASETDDAEQDKAWCFLGERASERAVQVLGRQLRSTVTFKRSSEGITMST